MGSAGQAENRERTATLLEAPAGADGDPDLSLVRRARDGSFEAFDTLVGRHERYLYTLALRIVRNEQDAEEVVQETFLGVVEHIKEFAEQSTFRTWLVRIATNHALKVLRRRRTHPAILMNGPDPDERRPLPHPEFIAPWRDEPLNLAQEKETQRLLAEAIEALDDKYRLVFQLRDVQGLSTEETARALGLTESNVKVRLLRARLMLRERLTVALGDREREVAPHHRKEPTALKGER